MQRPVEDLTAPNRNGGRVGGRLADNVVHFARVLRAAGAPVGTDRILLALRALDVAGIAARAEFHATLRTCMIDRADHLPLFDQAFEAFWRDPDLLGQLLRLRLPAIAARVAPLPAPENRRLAEALQPAGSSPDLREQRTGQPQLTVAMSWSDRERLRKADFDTMSGAEWRAACALVAQLNPLLPRLASRRLVAARRGPRLDGRALLRAAARAAGDPPTLPRSRRRTSAAPLVLLIDISGSMSRYSRMFLYFAQSLTAGPGSAGRRVYTFVFGTRLTAVTRALRTRDPDAALATVVRAVDDWAGGTRISHCLNDFNCHWLRRLPLSAATVLLLSDGLDLAAFDRLAAETRRLSLGCRRLLWLNPLLRFDGFEPQARGVRAMLPYVDRMLPAHNVESLEELAKALCPRGAEKAGAWS